MDQSIDWNQSSTNLNLEQEVSLNWIQDAICWGTGKTTSGFTSLFRLFPRLHLSSFGFHLFKDKRLSYLKFFFIYINCFLSLNDKERLKIILKYHIKNFFKLSTFLCERFVKIFCENCISLLCQVLLYKNIPLNNKLWWEAFLASLTKASREFF